MKWIDWNNYVFEMITPSKISLLNKQSVLPLDQDFLIL